MRFCTASPARRSAWPCASAASMAAERRIASAVRSSPGADASAATGLGAGLAATGLAAALRDDIDVVPALHDLEGAQLLLPIADELARLDVVLVAMPGAHEVPLGVGKIQAARG